jgi:hypothetical protein
MEETKDPFTTFGGHEVDTESDPFAKFGGMEVKKKLSTNALESGGQPLKIGGITDLNSLISTPQNNDPYTVITDHALKNNKLHQQVTNNLPYNNGSDEATFSASKKQGTIGRIGTGLKSTAGNFLHGVAESTISPLYYAGNKLGLVSDKDYADVQEKIASKPLLGLHPDYLKQGGGKFQRTVGEFASMAPALITAEGTGGGSFGLQTMGDAATQVQQMKKAGVKFDNHSDDLFVLGSGIIGTALGSGSVGKVFGSFGKGVQKEVATNLASEVIKDLGKKAESYTADDIAKAFITKAQSFGEKVTTGGLEAFKTYAKTGGEMAAANAATFALKKGANALNDEEPFKDTKAADLVDQVEAPFYNKEDDANGNPLTALANIATSPAGMFGTLHGAGTTLGLLSQKGGYFNPVVDRIRENSSPEAINGIKGDIAEIAQEKGWSSQELQQAHSGVDMLAETVGKLPKQLPKEKLAKAVDLVIGRNDLQKELEAAQEQRKNLDPSVSDIPTAHEQLITDKIDQANDKIRASVTGDNITYSKGTGDEEGKFFKTIGGKKEEITPQRYDLENMERSVKAADRKPVDVPVENVETPLPVEEQPVVKENLPTETPSDNEPISPIRQKAIDAVTHGIVGHINAREGEQGARFDLGMSAKENRKAVSDVMNGKYETGPAKKLLSKIEEFETNGDYPIIEGTGGNSIRRRGATPEEIQQNIDEAKQYKAQKLSEEQSAQFNTHAQEHGLTEEDFDNYEKYRTDPTGEPASIARDAQNVTDKVQQPSNDGTASPSQDTSSEIAQDVPTKRAGVEQPKAGDPLRSFADKVRQGKINKLGGFRASTGFDGVWDGSLEVVAKSIEGGAKIADAIESGLNHIKQTDWYKSLSERESFDEQYRNHLNNEYTEHEKTSPIKNATSEERAAEQGLKIEDTRNGKRGADIVDADAAKTISEGYDTPDLVHRILNEKHQASDTEVAILSKYADAKEKEIKDYDKDLTDNGATMSKGDFNAILAKKEQALSDLQDVLQAARKTGTETARALAARRNAYSQEYSLANMVARKRESLGGEKLTKEQFDDINKRFDELEEARNDFEAKVKKLEEENAKLRANQNVKQTAAERLKRKSVKLEGIDTKKKQLVEDWRKELKKIRTSMSATVPYARELAATAPFVTKYLKYLAEEGVVELKDIVDRIHETFKEDLPDLTKRDVVDILAGNYDEQKPTRSKLTSDIQSLKTQAKLLAQIEDLEKGIKSDNPNSNSERGKNEAVQRLRTRLKELQSEDEPTPDEKDISAYKKRIQARIDDVQERLDNDDYEKPEKKVPLKLDQEALELRRKYDRLKSNFDIEVAKDQLRQRTKTQKFWDDFLNVAALPRALKASLDFSAVLRQGLFASVGHPTIALKAFKEMFGQTFSEKRYSDWLSDIKHSEFYDLMQDSDLYISDKNDPKLLAREEEFTSNLGEKIPVLGKAIAASERAYTGYLNVLRTGVFADGAQRLIERGYTFEKNPEQFKALAKVVNVLTGRGDIPEFLGGKQPKVLSNVLFSPRFMASRIQTLYLWADPRLTGAARVMAAKDIGSTLALGGVILGLAHLSGLKVVTDPRSSQFLKVQDKEEHGTTYYDILGGLPQYVRFLSQQISGKKVPNNGGVIDLTTGKFGKPTRLSEAANFARGKVSPFVGMGLNLMEGKDVVGQPYHLWPNVPQEFTPLPFSDVQEAYKVGGIDNALKTFLPSQFGVGVSSYDPKSKKKK